MTRKRKWLQGAIKERGAFTAWCKRRGYKSVTCACVREAYSIAKKRNDRTLMGRALIAARANGGCGIAKGDIARWARKPKKRKKRR